MVDANNDALGMLRRLTETFGRAKFGNGVVGKTGHGMIGILIVWVIVAWRLSGTWVLDLPLVLVGLAATGVFMWWTRSTQKFAERNPAQAMLEGAEFLAYKKFEVEAKGGLVGSRELSGDPTKSLPATPLDTRPDQ